ncbi:hypothetical protein QJS04_geneDACA001647 [Acorus gramineus]|uniref:Protein unc-45 homolog B n=1 Tax=Acorus gramineus TaxID=55184 RepID=A0AAV9BG17_ACOGR|nr:hypothetical protein QJS04_geneDACA001647 [Acorus gramineus]
MNTQQQYDEKPNKHSGKACCFFKAMKESDPHHKTSILFSFFHAMPHVDDPLHVLAMSALWSLAMSHPDDPTLPSLPPFFPSMASLIHKGLNDPNWLYKHQNIYIPYYAAHVIGSYTISTARSAELAVESGVIPPLVELLRGRLSWVEQRVAVRALGHLASYDATFEAIALHEEEIVALAMGIASTCLENVYIEFMVIKKRNKENSLSLKYQRELLSRGLGDEAMEDRRAEEWASQLQCWSIHLLSCFASRRRSSIRRICGDDGRFLKDLCNMWGGLANEKSPAGVGLLRILCRSRLGRKSVSQHKEVILSLCNLCRSSDDWQYMGIDCLLLLLHDENTRPDVVEVAGSYLADLVELQELGNRRDVGDEIAHALLIDFKDGAYRYNNDVTKRALEMVWDVKVERRKREDKMSREAIENKRRIVSSKRRIGNGRFLCGDIEGSIEAYTEALELCPLKLRKERLVLYSNRAQCHLLLREPDDAISDSTRALSLSSPANSHGKSLWRRSQAYDAKGLAKESLLDCLMFLNGSLISTKEKKDKKNTRVPNYAVNMITKQMNAVGFFTDAAATQYLMTKKNRAKSESIWGQF